MAIFVLTIILSAKQLKSTSRRVLRHNSSRVVLKGTSIYRRCYGFDGLNICCARIYSSALETIARNFVVPGEQKQLCKRVDI